MRRSSSCIVLAILVAGALAATVDVAAARNFFTPGENFIRSRWAEWTVEIGEGGVVRCPLTIEASFHGRTFHKIVGVLVGYVARALINEAACRSEGLAGTRARIQLLGAVPWHLRYRSFAGTLPRPTAVGMDVLGPAVRISELLFGQSCLYGTAGTTPLQVSFALNASGQVTGLANELALSLNEGGGACTSRIVGAGSGAVSAQSSSSLVTISLI